MEKTGTGWEEEEKKKKKKKKDLNVKLGKTYYGAQNKKGIQIKY